jgi:hypothetical protein
MPWPSEHCEFRGLARGSPPRQFRRAGRFARSHQRGSAAWLPQRSKTSLDLARRSHKPAAQGSMAARREKGFPTPWAGSPAWPKQ